MTTGSPPIKVAGIGMSWDDRYAASYAAKLQEMGFCAKKYEASDARFLVGYSYRPFALSELEQILDDLLRE